MQVTKEKIQQFLGGGCTAAEAEEIAAWLKKHPEVLNGYLEQDWHTAADEGQLSQEESKAMYQQLLQQLSLKKSSIFTIKKMGLVAAASLLCLVVATFYNAHKQPATTVTQTTAAIIPAATATTWVVCENNGVQKKKINLPDGSIAVLSGNSRISYQQPFPAHKRDIHMNGQVYFSVHKDQSKPFTVYAGNTATTALGTAFRIHMQQKNITIQLFNGKVKIQPITKTAKGWDSTIYLLPGEQLQYNIAKSSTTISAFIQKNAHEEVSPTTTLSFNNEPIDKVFDQLSVKYKVTILYNKKEINGISFTGNVMKNDSLPLILHIIGKMNGLETDQQNNAFIIKKTAVPK
ncbi:MAG: FecR family protein [Chitinophaga sp.]|uniref:FecR family protein n=1 Tax=Chitinophaga sp. TaxID=1869181 RepID=UPI001B296950|nr:FecR family protein [Chitinophaga sp.]MBO9727990.1 FecR family protein [Chitinophaga sp.]